MLKVLWMVVFGLFAIGIAGNIALQLSVWLFWDPDTIELFCSSPMTASLCE